MVVVEDLLKKKGKQENNYNRIFQHLIGTDSCQLQLYLYYDDIYIYFKYTYRTTQHFDNGYQRTFLIQARQVEPEKFVTSTTE